MKKINYKKLCELLNVTDKDVKSRMEEANKDEKYGFEWIVNVVNPGCKLTVDEIGEIWKSLNWAKKSAYPKYFELSSIAAMLFCYRVKELNEPVTL